MKILDLNAELRKTRCTRATPDESGHVAFSMPEADYWLWTQKYPDLAAPDSEIARRAWTKFLRSDEGRPYCINPTEGKRMPTDGIIVR